MKILSNGGNQSPKTAQIGQSESLSHLPIKDGRMLSFSTSSSSSTDGSKAITGKDTANNTIWSVTGDSMVAASTWTKFMFYDGNNYMYFILSSVGGFHLCRVTCSSGGYSVLGTFQLAGQFGSGGYVERENLESGDFTWYAGNKILVISSTGLLISNTQQRLSGVLANDSTNASISGGMAPDGRKYAVHQGEINLNTLTLQVSTKLGSTSINQIVLQNTFMSKPTNSPSIRVINWGGFVMLTSHFGTSGNVASRCWNKNDFWRWLDEEMGEIT